MNIAAIHEGSLETRVAITPTAVKHFLKLGWDVICESDAGKASGFNNDDYTAAGATIINNRKNLLQEANILLCVNEPLAKDIRFLKPESMLIGPLNKDNESNLMQWCLKHRVNAFSMNYIPRISRAQGMDSLSSQANLAGYRAVLEAVAHFKRAIPMMMTAAGMIQPAKVLVLGAGVAGLQAIATAKRLGAVVYAFDIRTAAKEQVESLGAEFIQVDEEQNLETESGYAREAGPEYQRLQGILIDKYARLADIIICTALIPNRKAPILLKATTVDEMKSGSVIVDLATASGGNCELSVRDEVIHYNNLTLVGYSNIAGLIPTSASELYANNLVNLLRSLIDTSGKILFNEKDEIIQQAMLCHDGQYLPFQYSKEH